MAIHGDDDFLDRQTQFLRRRIHDADIGLVGNQPVDLFRLHPGGIEYFVGDFGQYLDGDLEYRLAVHLQKGRTGYLSAAHLARYGKNAAIAAVGMQRRGEDTGIIAGL